MKHGFKTLRVTKPLEPWVELEEELNEFFKVNTNFIPKSVSITGHGTTNWLTAIVLYEDISK
jgi:hypothetical protein